jgi:hypothetical protein
MVSGGFEAGLAQGQGGYAGAFTRIGIGPRPLAMGGAFSAVADGPETFYYNVAGLPHLKQRELTASLRVMSLDRSFTYVGYAQPVRPDTTGQGGGPLNGGFALAWVRAGVDNIDGRDFDGRKFADLSYEQHLFALSFALSPTPFLSAGFGAKLFLSRFPGITDEGEAVSSQSVGFDLGILVRPHERVSFGFAVRDLNAKYTWNTDKLYERGTSTVDRFPVTLVGGVAVQALPGRLMLALDVEKNNQQDGLIRVGGEFRPQREVSLRAGLNDGSPTFGAGYGFDLLGRRAFLNYAYITLGGSLSSEHVFAWTFRF